MGVPKFEITHGLQNRYQWRYLSAGDKEIMIGKPASIKAGCFEAIRMIKQNAMTDHLYQRAETPDKFSFKLKSPSHKVVAESVVFATLEEREAAIQETRISAQAAILDKA